MSRKCQRRTRLDTALWRRVLAAGCLSWAVTFLPSGNATGDGEEWARAVVTRAWEFPRDHGAHPEYRTEWWYFTGGLLDASGNRYGYQLTFFRQGIRKELPARSTPWSVRDVFMAHFALTDISSGRFLWKERASRTGPGLAGADTAKMEVWVLNWRARMEGEQIFLDAVDEEKGLSLRLVPTKPVVLHGDGGLSRKGAGEGQASHYVSLTALETSGLIRSGRDSKPVEVRGKSWFDHEFGSNQLGPDQRGWDWFGLHLSDGRDLMIYHLRRVDGSLEPASSGTLVERDGTCRHLPLGQFSVDVLGHWRSPKSGGLYPNGWRIRVPSQALDVHLSPLLPDQELLTESTTRIVYWEGAVEGKGRSRGTPVSCEGYAELTGYAGSLAGAF